MFVMLFRTGGDDDHVSQHHHATEPDVCSTRGALRLRANTRPTVRHQGQSCQPHHF